MPVNSINNISFSGRNVERKEAKRARKEEYYKWVSQNQANDALKLSLGREVEDGKYKAAEAAFSAAALIGTLASFIAKTLVVGKVSSGAPITSKLIRQNKAANIGVLASAGALIVGNMIRNHNIKEADKTANDRGFLSTKDRMKIKNADLNYYVTNEIYNSHVN